VSWDLFATVQAIVRQEVDRLRGAELAVVREQHPHAADGDGDNYACTVALRDSGLVLARVPVATGRIGSAGLPAVGDLVLVQFLRGDVNAPVITGSFYNDEDRPPVNGDGRAVLHLPLGAADADAVRGELASGERRELTFALGEGLTARLADDDPVLELSVDGGKATLAVARDGTVTFDSGGELVLSAEKVRVEGSEIAVEATGTLKLTGATVEIN
jgi:phage baseplate assembly protein gpV